MPSKRCTEEIHNVFRAAAAGETVRLSYPNWTSACAGRHFFHNCRKQLRTELGLANASLIKNDGLYTEAQRAALAALVSAADTCIIRLRPNRKPPPEFESDPAMIIVDAAYSDADPTIAAINAAGLGVGGPTPTKPPPKPKLNPADEGIRKVFAEYLRAEDRSQGGSSKGDG